MERRGAPARGKAPRALGAFGDEAGGLFRRELDCREDCIDRQLVDELGCTAQRRAPADCHNIGVEGVLAQAREDLGADRHGLGPVDREADHVDVPVFVYQVSGEYAMIEAAAAVGAGDRDALVLETLMAFKRAGCSGILSYHSPLAAKLLNG